MGEYLGVRCVEAKGIKVPFADAPSKKQPFIPEGYILVGIMQNSRWRIAPILTEKSEYQAFYNDFINRKRWISMTLYLLRKELIKECPDEGRAHG